MCKWYIFSWFWFNCCVCECVFACVLRGQVGLINLWYIVLVHRLILHICWRSGDNSGLIWWRPWWEWRPGIWVFWYLNDFFFFYRYLYIQVYVYVCICIFWHLSKERKGLCLIKLNISWINTLWFKPTLEKAEKPVTQKRDLTSTKKRLYIILGFQSFLWLFFIIVQLINGAIRNAVYSCVVFQPVLLLCWIFFLPAFYPLLINFTHI